MALCLVMMFCRIGAVVGINVVGAMIYNACMILFIIDAILTSGKLCLLCIFYICVAYLILIVLAAAAICWYILRKKKKAVNLVINN